jgi:hypothetical protein
MNYPAASSGVSKPQYFFDNTNAPRGGECTLSDSKMKKVFGEGQKRDN